MMSTRSFKYLTTTADAWAPGAGDGAVDGLPPQPTPKRQITISARLDTVLRIPALLRGPDDDLSELHRTMIAL